MKQWPAGLYVFFEKLMEGRVCISLGEDLLKETGEQFENWPKGYLLSLIKLGAGKISAAACFNLYRLNQAGFPKACCPCDTDDFATTFSPEFLRILAANPVHDNLGVSLLVLEF